MTCIQEIHHMIFITASELVDWLISSGEAEDRRNAVQLGQLLLETDFIHHVVDEHNFEDGYLFFRFRQDGMIVRFINFGKKSIPMQHTIHVTVTKDKVAELTCVLGYIEVVCLFLLYPLNLVHILLGF